MKTKDKIVLATIKLFNKHGFANVILQQVASELHISLGNLTYHFRKKDDLVEEIYKRLVKELREVLNGFQIEPNLKSLDDQVRAFYDFQEQYRFFYLDTLEIERAYPEIAVIHYKHIQQQIDGIAYMMLINCENGNFTAAFDEDTRGKISHKIWMIVALWAAQTAIRGIVETSADEMAAAIWLLLKPYFTPKGATLYQKLRK